MEKLPAHPTQLRERGNSPENVRLIELIYPEISFLKGIKYALREFRV